MITTFIVAVDRTRQLVFLCVTACYVDIHSGSCLECSLDSSAKEQKVTMYHVLLYDIILCYRRFFYLTLLILWYSWIIWLLIVCGKNQQRAEKLKLKQLTTKITSSIFFKTQSSDLPWPVRLIYLVFVCAWLELFELIVEHGELPSDALYPSMQTPVFAVLSVEIVFISLALLRRVDHCVLPMVNKERKFWKKVIKHTKREYFFTISNNTVWKPHSRLDTQKKYLYTHNDTIYFWILTINTLQLLLMMKTNYWCCCTFHSDLKYSFEIKWYGINTNVFFNGPLWHILQKDRKNLDNFSSCQKCASLLRMSSVWIYV